MKVFINFSEPVICKDKALAISPADLDDFLAAYYLFSTLTPPGSLSLALHYIKRAISLNHHAEYDEWLDLIKKGN